jgi:hypothetical protein
VIRGYECQNNSICVVIIRQCTERFGYLEGKLREDKFIILKLDLQW